jgi:CPA1 family monovalent cation:H+ antiporter
VLAVMTASPYLSWRWPSLTGSETRLQGIAVWDMGKFLLNGLIFVILGLQLPAIIESSDGRSLTSLVWLGAVVSLTVILARIFLIFPATYLSRLVSRRLREGELARPWQEVAIIAWGGMRGVLSLAAALAVPLTLDSGTAFPERDLIVFLAFSVILATLVLQGLTLPLLIRALKVGDGGLDRREEARARFATAQAGLLHLDQLANEAWAVADVVDDLRGYYIDRIRRHSESEDNGRRDAENEHPSDVHHRLLRNLLDVERGVVIGLRNRGVIGDEVMHRLQHELDLEEQRLVAVASAPSGRAATPVSRRIRAHGVSEAFHENAY